MKLDKIFDVHVLTGIALGVLIGLHYPVLGELKLFLGIAALVMGLKVVGVLK
jgi:hypothetical protein